MRRFQLHQREHNVGESTINATVSALRFLLGVTLERPDLSRRLVLARRPRKLPDVLSVEEVATLIALASSRFWPLWVAGLQLTTLLGHALKAIDWSLLPRAYGAALVFWSYPILSLLAVGAWRAHRRTSA